MITTRQWKVIAILFLLAVPSGVTAQDSVSVNEGFIQTDSLSAKKVIASGVVGGLLVGSLVSSYFDWWKGSNEPFHIVHEGVFNDYSLGVDKLGHMYTSYFYFHTFRNIMLWGGYGRSAALWWSAGTTAFFAVSIEIGDGLSPFGFSFEDLAFNMAGLGYGILQTEFPFLRNFALKWSYVPRTGYRWPPHFTDNYDWHTYWLAVNVHNLLPEAWRKYWPAFLNVAVGYGVDDYAANGKVVRTREVAVGLDFNLEAFQIDNQEILLLQKIVNMIHLPAPAVKFTGEKEPRYYLFSLD